MSSAENSANDSAQSPACSRKALPAATCASEAIERARLAGKDQRGQGGELLQDPLEIVRVGPLGLLRGGEVAPALRAPLGWAHGPTA